MLFVSDTKQYARVAQLVEHDLAKVGAAGSSPVSRSQVKKKTSEWMSSFLLESNPGLEGLLIMLEIVLRILR